jgi:hypothetical protein
MAEQINTSPNSNADIQHWLNSYFDNELPAPTSETVDRKWLLTCLTEAIHRLLQHHPEQLAQALYRVDVREEQVNEAFGLTDSTAIARKLALLVIEREEEKAAFRERFRNNAL